MCRALELSGQAVYRESQSVHEPHQSAGCVTPVKDAIHVEISVKG